MKKVIFTAIACLSLACTSASALADEPVNPNNNCAERIRRAAGLVDEYPINPKFNKATTRVNSFKYLAEVSVDGATAPACDKADHMLYIDKHNEAVFTVEQGATVKVDMIFGEGASWIHGYVFVDYNDDKQFTATVDDQTHKPAAGSELVSYSCISGRGNNNHFDSAGDNFTDNDPRWNKACTGLLPSFKIPADLKPGDYRMRFKTDFNAYEPGGSDAIVNNGGTIVDVTLRVMPSDPTGIKKVDTSSSDKSAPIYNLQGQRVKDAKSGIYIQGKRKFVVK